MLRVLTLSSLFPNAARPTLGVFVERQTLGLAAREDVEVRVVAPVGLPLWPLSWHPHYRPLTRLPERETWHGLVVHRERFTTWPGQGAHLAAREMARAVGRLLDHIDFAFDVIDAEFFWPDGVAAMHLAARIGVPFSVKARGSDIYLWGDRPRIGKQVRQAAQRADGLLAVSASLKAEMVARGMPEDKIRIHHTGVDLDRFRPVERSAAKAALGIEGPLLVTAGALIPRKGQALAIDALARLPEAVLLLVGEGPDRSALARLARRLGVDQRVRFLGARRHAELPALLAAADVAVQPSAAEGLANVWVEALACGTPVVTCDAGGAREAIDRPAAGRIVPRDAAAIAAAVGALLADPPAQADVREAAGKFSWDRNAAELFDHLARVAGK